MKPEEKVLATRYAEGIYLYSKSERKVQECLQWLDDILHLLADYPEVRKIILNPNIALNEKMNFLERLTEDKIPPYLLIFLRLLVRRNRFLLLPAIAEVCHRLDEQDRGFVRVEGRVPMPLSEEQKREIIHVLEQRLQKKIIWQEKIDKRVIGGIAVLIGDRIIDDSLRNHLEQLKKSLSVKLAEAKGGR